jgi:glycosyltransferase involved in cell wall biosynthesis
MEALEDGVNGLLVDFFDHEAIAARVIGALDRLDDLAPLRERARETVLARYELAFCLDRQLGLMRDLAAGFRPAAPAIL